MEFSIGSVHENNKGRFKVLQQRGDSLVIQYDNGVTKEVSKKLEMRIVLNYLRKKENEKEKIKKFQEEKENEQEKIKKFQEEEKAKAREKAKACDALIREGVPFHPEDNRRLFSLYRSLVRREETKELHTEFLKTNSIPLTGVELIKPFPGAGKPRETYCYYCRKSLDSSVDLTCSKCRWLVCPQCGACGCGYSSDF